MTGVEWRSNSPPYARHVSAGLLVERAADREEQLRRLANDLVGPVHGEPERCDHERGERHLDRGVCAAERAHEPAANACARHDSAEEGAALAFYSIFGGVALEQTARHRLGRRSRGLELHAPHPSGSATGGRPRAPLRAVNGAQKHRTPNARAGHGRPPDEILPPPHQITCLTVGGIDARRERPSRDRRRTRTCADEPQGWDFRRVSGRTFAPRVDAADGETPYGKANTLIELPRFSGSVSSAAAASPRAPINPSPFTTATYCLPATA